jgi:hypothetical protein
MTLRAEGDAAQVGSKEIITADSRFCVGRRAF